MRSTFAILVTLAACHDPALDRLTAIRDTVCACKTLACADQAIGQAAEGAGATSPRKQALARAMLDCLAKLQAAGQPITDPDAEAPDPAAAGSAAPVTAPRTSDPASARTP